MEPREAEEARRRQRGDRNLQRLERGACLRCDGWLAGAAVLVGEDGGDPARGLAFMRQTAARHKQEPARAGKLLERLRALLLSPAEAGRRPARASAAVRRKAIAVAADVDTAARVVSPEPMRETRAERGGHSASACGRESGGCCQRCRAAPAAALPLGVLGAPLVLSLAQALGPSPRTARARQQQPRRRGENRAGDSAAGDARRESEGRTETAAPERGKSPWQARFRAARAARPAVGARGPR